jgi:hypothetical protein
MTILVKPALTRDAQRFASESSKGVRHVMFVLVQKYLLYGSVHHAVSRTHPRVAVGSLLLCLALLTCNSVVFDAFGLALVMSSSVVFDVSE